MATFLLLVIYVAFVGLGIPDSIFGSAWPAIYNEWNIPISYASVVTTTISLGTVVASVLSGKLINKLGTGGVTAISTALTAVSLFGFSVANSVVWFIILAVPMGMGAGAIDSALNNYVAVHYKASHMNFLHCFYGIGVMLSPLLMSFALADNNEWRSGYRWAVYIQLVITVLAIIALPIWNKVNPQVKNENEVKTEVRLADVVKMPSVRTVWLILIGSVALEFTCGTWGATYLVEGLGVSADKAALSITFYYVGMASGRFASGIASSKLNSWTIIKVGQIVTFFALLAVTIPIGVEITVLGMFLIGFGNGPVFPNIAHLTPLNFGVEKSQMVMGTQMAASYVGVTVAPLIFGLLAEKISVSVFGYFLFAMYAVMLSATVVFKKKYVNYK